MTLPVLNWHDSSCSELRSAVGSVTVTEHMTRRKAHRIHRYSETALRVSPPFHPVPCHLVAPPPYHVCVHVTPARHTCSAQNGACGASPVLPPWRVMDRTGGSRAAVSAPRQQKPCGFANCPLAPRAGSAKKSRRVASHCAGAC